MNQVQINVIRLQFLQGSFQRALDVGDVGQDFGHDVEFVACDARFFDGGAEFCFGFVDFGAVEVVVV